MAANSSQKPAEKAQSAQNANEVKHKANPQWRAHFLDALAENSNVTEAARAAKVTPSRAYKVRRQDAPFRKAWNEALLEGYEHLEMETLHRLRIGTGKDDNKFDIANALRLLMLHRETIARERSLRSREDEQSVLATLNAKIDAMRQREAEMKRLQAAPREAESPICDS